MKSELLQWPLKGAMFHFLGGLTSLSLPPNNPSTINNMVFPPRYLCPIISTIALYFLYPVFDWSNPLSEVDTSNDISEQDFITISTLLNFGVIDDMGNVSVSRMDELEKVLAANDYEELFQTSKNAPGHPIRNSASDARVCGRGFWRQARGRQTHPRFSRNGINGRSRMDADLNF